MSVETEILRKEIERLSAEVERLNYNLNRSMAAALRYDELLRRNCNLIERDVEGAFDRIINLELTIFPNLQKDMNDVYRVIGEGENRADNPLDRREK